MALEVVTAITVSVVFFASCLGIEVDALDRVGQVSAIADLAFRFSLGAIALVVALVVARRRSPEMFERVTRLACAAAAGLVSGFVAGAVLVMLRTTPYGLAAGTGDSLVMSDWARMLLHGKLPAGVYPPGQIHLIAWFAQLFDIDPLYAIKPFQLLAVLVVAPAAYLSWRLILPPLWALGVGVTVSLPLIEAYRQYPLLVLVVFIPVALHFLGTLRTAPERDPLALVRRGVAYGLVFGLLFLLYSGWFQWSAPGILVAGAIWFPWRTAPRRGAALCVVTAVVFVLVSLHYFIDLRHAPAVRDLFMYFDSRVDPSYITMWKGDLPGSYAALWPPLGELGGVGLFTVLLGVGFAAAIAVAASQTPVLGTALILIGTWLLRFWYARAMFATKLVQLYPRTTAEILYCLLVLAGLAVYFGWRRTRRVVNPTVVIGVLCGLLFVYEQAVSSIADRYMPRETDNDQGHLAYLALTTPRIEGNLTKGARAEASNDAGGPAANAIDDKPATVFATAPSPTADHEESLALWFPGPRTFQTIALVPGPEGYPADFTIDVWDQKWIPRLRLHDQQRPAERQVIVLKHTERTNGVRIHVTRLGTLGSGYGFSLGELEVRR